MEVKGLGGKTLSRRLINPVNIKLMEIEYNLILDSQVIERFGDELVELARKVSITIFSCVVAELISKSYCRKQRRC